MGTFAADIRYALRMLWKNPAFTAVAVAALALGIGANTAIFTVVNAVLLQPLPYPEPERIVRLARQFPGGAGNSISVPKYMTWRQNQSFEATALYGLSGPGLNVGSGDRPEQVKSLQVSRDFFAVFGTAPLMGRSFNQAEDLPNGPRVVVLSYGTWQSRFAADPQLLGRTILLNAEPYNVIGIMPKGFESDPAADVWISLQADPHSTNQGHYLAVAARLKPGVSLMAAQAEMKIVGDRFRRENPLWMDKTESVAVIPMREATVGDAKTPLLILLGSVLFVLLIACANVANLLLARAAVRQRELAIRAAIGASRTRVIRQLLTESVLLATLGGALGFAIGVWGVRALLLVVPGNIPRLTTPDGQAQIPALDWKVAAFTMGVAVLTAIIFGLLPALHTSKPDIASTLRESSGRSGTSRRQNWTRSVLVVSEVALALVLLAGSALLIRTFVGLRTVKPGFEAHNVFTMTTSMAGGVYTTTGKVDTFATQVLDRIEALPGVEAAATATILPLEGGIDMPFNIAGKPPAKGDLYNGDEQYRPVSKHYFSVFKIPLMRGRVFGNSDTVNSARVVIINDAMARQYWPKEDPVGQVITIGKGLGPQFEDVPRQIVGVVGSVRETGLNAADQGVIYIPQNQMPEGLTALANQVIPLSWAIRTVADPFALKTAIERELRSVDSLIPLSQERLMEQVVSRSVARQDFNALLLGIFAGIAVLLAAIGIYGLMSYAVEQRTQEIGIRMALGARQGGILKLVMWQGMRLAAIGVMLGLAAAIGLTRVLGTLLFGVKASDPLTFGIVAAILTLVALLATYVPARRAACVEPTEALRCQ